MHSMGFPTSFQVGQVLEKLAETGDQIPKEHCLQLGQPPKITPFHARTPAPISVTTYFVTVAINAGLADSQAILCLILVERLCQAAGQKEFALVLNALTAHR